MFVIIGLTGSIGAGKTVVAEVLAGLGGVVIDADKIGHEVLCRDDVKQGLRKIWGDKVFSANCEIDRKKMANIVFEDPGNRKKLEDLLHPLMREFFLERIEIAQGEGVSAVILDAAILFEAGWDDLCTHTIFVDAPRELRLLRVQNGRGWDENELTRRETAQNSLDNKKERCTFCVENNSDTSHLNELVSNIFTHIFKSFG